MSRRNSAWNALGTVAHRLSEPKSSQRGSQPNRQQSHLLGENLLVTYDVDDVERIPLWQLHNPDTADGRYILLPGLDVVIAAAPEDLQAPERLSFFMASLHPTLHIDGHPTTPYRWLAAGKPLRTIVALLDGRRW